MRSEVRALPVWIQDLKNVLSNLYQSYDWISDTLDIVLIACLIYWVIRFVRKTNTAQVLKGILILLAVMWLAQILNLSVVSYLLGETFDLGIVVIIVLFQPEIRRMLEQVGGSKKFGFFISKGGSYGETEYAVNQVVLACSDLSKSKTGALIVFERNISLESYCRTGTAINATPAAELIKNVFVPNTPLHDGAMVITGGRISSAACMLPLTGNLSLSRELGMRHRAGIGISERTDAVVAIVSEETGALSVATDGVLRRGLTPEMFDKVLRSELLPKNEKNSSKLRRLFTEGGK